MTEKSSDKLFYISYANLLAGLFFIMLFIVAGILLKNSLAKGEIYEQKANLRAEKLRFEREKEAFKHEQDLVFKLGQKIKDGQILSKTNTQISSVDAEILALLARIDERDRRFKGLNEDFELLKTEFKELGFVKNNFVFEIQAKFDANISTNDSGAVILQSEDFFEHGSHFIKNESKVKLRGILSEFFNAVLRNKDFLSGLDFVNIQIFVGEGLAYPKRVELAFKRAEELSSFIEGFYKDKRIFDYLLINPAQQNKRTNSQISISLIMSNNYLLQKMQDILDK